MQINTTDKQTRVPLFLRVVTPQFRANTPTKLKPAKQSAFILSTGRTGTVYLADLLNQLNGVYAVHEPKPSRVLNAWTTAFLEGKISNNFMAAALAGKRKRSLSKLDKQIYVEANNFIAGFADAINQTFENPTIIHIVRDPREFITSLTNRGDNAGLRKFFNQYVPYWAYLPKGIKKRELTPLTRPAYRWAAINQYLNKYGASHGSYHLFKFEDVFNKKDPQKIEPLLRAIGLTDNQIAQLDYDFKSRLTKRKLSLLDSPVDSQNRSKHQAMTPWQEWTKEQKQEVDRICGELMRQYGYGNEAKWQNSLE